MILSTARDLLCTITIPQPRKRTCSFFSLPVSLLFRLFLYTGKSAASASASAGSSSVCHPHCIVVISVAAMVGNATPAVSDQRKHALEALQRRFDSANAELLQQQQQASIKQSNKEAEEKGEGKRKVSSLATAPAIETDKSGRSSSTPLSKKGNFAFSGHTPSRGTPGASDAEASGTAYSQLCLPVHENLLTSDAELSSKRGSVVDKILHEFLQHGDSAQKYIQGSRSMKIDNWLLLDSFVQGRGSRFGACNRASHIHSKRSKRHMSMKQHRKQGSFTLSHEFHKFEIFKPMHEMWKDYIMQLFKNAGKTQLAQCLLTADLHGAILLVVECKATSFTGASGIMVRETAETFGIITQDDKFRVVPKRDSVFVIQAGCWKVTLHGDKFTSRNLNT